MKRSILEIHAGTEEPQRHEVPEAIGDVVVGRSPECTISISEGSVSRRHAKITRSGEELLVEDLGSSNGTFVDGVRITAPTPLADGSDVVFGKIKARFAVEEVEEEVGPEEVSEQPTLDGSKPFRPETAGPGAGEAPLPETAQPRSGEAPEPAAPPPEQAAPPEPRGEPVRPETTDTGVPARGEEPPESPAAEAETGSTRGTGTVSHTAQTAPTSHPSPPARPVLPGPGGAPNWAELAVIFVASFALTAGVGWLLLRFF